MSTLLSEGDEALKLLGDLEHELRGLHDQCAWATRFQSPEFLKVWYSSYRTEYTPLLIHRIHGDRLTGFLALALARDGRIAHAGDHQAEYQCWLAERECSDAFLQDALTLLQRRHARGQLRFKYLPPAAPLDWAKERLSCGGQAHVRAHIRPLLRLQDRKALAKSLKKRSNRSRLNRLKRYGDVQFKRPNKVADLTGEIDRIADIYDFRQCAAHGVSPFREDARKRNFYLALMSAPDLLQAAILTVGDEIAAAHLGILDRGNVMVGVYAHSPFFARHSPGKILMQMLASDLAALGMEAIDLTPGDGWKSRFANAHDEVNEVTVYFHANDARREQGKEAALAAARTAVRLLGRTPDEVRQFLRNLSRLTPAKLLRKGKATVWLEQELMLYYYDAQKARQLAPVDDVTRDSLQDLLDFMPAEPWQSRQNFLAECESRLADGHHVYTHVEKGRLVHYGWLAEIQEQSFFSEVEQVFAYPANTAVLYDFYTVPQARRRGLYQRSLRAMLRDAANGPTDRVAISVLADNTASRHVIEKLGFVYETSLYLQRRFGLTRRWRRAASARPND